MYYYIYKITLTAGSLKDHYYIGQHTTNDLNDGYKGSGRVVKDYYKKHPLDYTKEILYFCNSNEELNQKEYELIGNLWETDNMCLNLKSGGDRKGFSTETRAKMSTAVKASMTPEVRAKMSAAKKGKISGDKHPMYGKHHTEETRARMSGDGNPRAKSITIQNIITNEIHTFGCIKDCADFLGVGVKGTFRTKFLKGLSNRVPQLKNWRVI